MIKIVTIVGARPQFVKAAMLSRIFRDSDQINEILVHTGQHFDFNMDRIFFDELKISNPEYNLNINSLSHGAMTGKMLSRIEEILVDEKPDYVLVFGDTNSTLAGAIAAKKLHIKVIHVEAGLRSFNMKMPEEINRILTDRISDLLFCPTDNAVNNLNSEGFSGFPCTIVKSGDVMYDLALFFQNNNNISGSEYDQNNNFILCTIHREENTTEVHRLASIINGLNKIARETTIILPLHPRTKKIIGQNNLKCEFEVIEPVGYLEMIKYLQNCQLVITDSGGLQKEAYFFKKYCITLRKETEWTELVENGYNKLVDHDSSLIYDTYVRLFNKTSSFKQFLYGEGNACKIILNSILNHHLANI